MWMVEGAAQLIGSNHTVCGSYTMTKAEGESR